MSVDYGFTFDVSPDGNVLMHVREVPSENHLLTMDLHPDDADTIADAIKAQAARSRQRTVSGA